ncbi:hypothetical protein K458DRAFT_296171 [Lentithecium fluviatile CBS 122367]|uniref:Transmembrane protein n=1 Tax=Lentithecium fluviatile CBS 122367 TaxID=1168545 RepID=A0A6G1J9R6_9PLEO|nr:hypothetical protein K458DRAFT_296171 [Lentithecium fluviatile CBS 122367]
MGRRVSWILLLFAFLSLFSLSLAASPTSFCKCTCLGNSTIVPLDAPVNTQKPAPDVADRASKKTCNDCNRQFCLSYSFCKGEKEDNVFTTCFQRDSAKDQAVVWIFILATVGLLSYAGVRPWIDSWAEVRRHEVLDLETRCRREVAANMSQRARERRNYIPVSGQAE